MQPTRPSWHVVVPGAVRPCLETPTISSAERLPSRADSEGTDIAVPAAELFLPALHLTSPHCDRANSGGSQGDCWCAWQTHSVIAPLCVVLRSVVWCGFDLQCRRREWILGALCSCHCLCVIFFLTLRTKKGKSKYPERYSLIA